MTILLDSTVHIQWWRGRPAVVEWLVANAAEDLATSVVSVAEIFTGAGPQAEARWADYFARLRVVPIDERTGRAAGGLRFRLARSGQHLSLSDGLIAAQALLNDWPVATANAKGFAATGVRLIEVR